MLCYEISFNLHQNTSFSEKSECTHREYFFRVCLNFKYFLGMLDMPVFVWVGFQIRFLTVDARSKPSYV